MGASTAIGISAAATGADAESRLAVLAELSSDWFWETGADHHFVYLSDRRDGTIIRTAAALDRHLPELEARRTFRDLPCASTHDGRLCHLKISGKPRFDAAGHFLGYIGTATDVTAQVEAQIERDAGERRRTQLCTTLARTQKLDSIARLAGGIAHDLNNTLLPVMTLTELAIHELPEGSPARDDLERVIGAAEHARDIVRRLMTFSRIGRGPVGSSDLDASVAAAAELMGESLAAGLNLHLDLRVPATEVPLGESEIRQVVMNLVQNAAEAVGPAAGTIRIETVLASPADFPAGLDRTRTYARLRVTDDGPGIAPEILPRIFDPFFTTKPVGQGTGLGLAVVHGLVVQAGGSIAVEGARGARIEILLPVVAKQG